MSGYRIMPVAQRDLAGIQDYYRKEAGNHVARMMLAQFVEAFKLLARNPRIGHRREDLAEDRDLRFWTMRSFLIL